MSSTGTTLAASLGTKIRDRILRGEIAPGEKLLLENLRAEFGVSHSPLREALSTLAAQGFVVGEEQRGYRAAQVSPENLEEVTFLRSHLEAIALTESIRRGDDEWEERLVAVSHRLAKFERKSLDGGRIEEWEQAHRAFHAVLIQACNMKLLLQFCGVLHDLNDRYRRLFLESNPLDRDVHQEHERILRATLDRDVDRAVPLLRQHIERTGRAVAAAMRNASAK